MGQYFLDEAKSRLQEETLDRAIRNKKFIEEQIGKTVDALTRDRLYALYGQEVEREMMARNREQFGFRVIDSPRVPDRKFKPQRAMSAMKATLLAFFLSCAFFLVRGKGGKFSSSRAGLGLGSSSPQVLD
jgi:LPS O-antigen subunit length determinant protein (WzzB/FepE family)